MSKNNKNFQNLVFKEALKHFKQDKNKVIKNKPKEQQEKTQVIDFKYFFSDVKPLKNANQYIKHHQKPKPLPKKHINFSNKNNNETEKFSQISYIDLFDDTKDIKEYLRAGLSRDLLKKLKQGYWSVFEVWDIHGYKRDQFLIELNDVLCKTQNKGRCLKIIHGQGYGSKNQAAILKKLVRIVLSEHPKVLAFCNEHQQNSGAILVLLAAKRP